MPTAPHAPPAAPASPRTALGQQARPSATKWSLATASGSSMSPATSPFLLSLTYPPQATACQRQPCVTLATIAPRAPASNAPLPRSHVHEERHLWRSAVSVTGPWLSEHGAGVQQLKRLLACKLSHLALVLATMSSLLVTRCTCICVYGC
jgi:hypothetical protein